MTVERTCRVCGCTDLRACPGGCAWAGPDLCTNCTDVQPVPPTSWGTPLVALCSDGTPVHDFQGQDTCPSCGFGGVSATTPPPEDSPYSYWTGEVEPIRQYGLRFPISAGLTADAFDLSRMFIHDPRIGQAGLRYPQWLEDLARYGWSPPRRDDPEGVWWPRWRWTVLLDRLTARCRSVGREVDRRARAVAAAALGHVNEDDLW